jgi:tRNA (uracil-5-)-methyltransferase
VASRAEVAMKKEVQNVARDTPLVAVVDPARDGLHQDVIKALRNEFSLQRIVYVSCNPTGSLVKDAALLCSPCTKKYRGLPFKITSAQPVDMFPHTDHCEMVMVFDRMTQEECDGEKKQVVIEAISEGLEEKSKDVEMKQEGEIEASVDIVNKESEDNAEVKPE